MTHFLMFHQGRVDYPLLCRKSILRLKGTWFHWVNKQRREIPAGFEDKWLARFTNDCRNEPRWECRSLTRWFNIHREMERLGLTEAICTDSDVLWFDDPMPWVKEYDFTVSTLDGAVGVAVGKFTLKVLTTFCEWVKATIDDPAAIFQLHDDMSAWMYFHQTHPEFNRGDTNRVIRGVTFDHHIAITDGWDHDGPVKRFQWEGGHPYCEHSKHDKVRFVNIHYWNGYKPLMAEHWKKVTA